MTMSRGAERPSLLALVSVAWRKSNGPERIAHTRPMTTHGAEDRRAQRLDELHRPTPHDQVGADDEREQDDTDRAQPGQQGEQESWQPADGVGEVLLDRAAGADRGHSEGYAADEQDQGEDEPEQVGRAGGPGPGWVARRPRR